MNDPEIIITRNVQDLYNKRCNALLRDIKTT